MLETVIHKPDTIDTETLSDLDSKSRQIRALTLKAIYEARSGHSGPSLSMVEIVTSLLFKEMDWGAYLDQVKGKNEEDQWQIWQKQVIRDRFILSKGHAVPSWYAALAVGGYLAEEELKHLRSIGSRLQGHPERKRFPFIDATTGSLGQGQSVAMGFAMANKLKENDRWVYCISGDGEINEGQVWETALSAPKFKLDNLVIIVDRNKSQGEGLTSEIMDTEPLEEKWRAFRWHVQRVDGHNFSSLTEAFRKTKETMGQPHVIIADTRKGYLGDGQLFMGGQHNPLIDEKNYNEAMKFLGFK